MSSNVSDQVIKTEVTLTVELSGAEPVLIPGGRTDRYIRPTQAKLHYDDGQASSCYLTGPVVRKDGTDGVMTANAEWWVWNNSPDSAYSWSKSPDWFRDLVEAHRPFHPTIKGLS